MSKSNRIFDHLTGGTTQQTKRRKRSGGLLDQRHTELSELASGAVEDKVYRWVDPVRCRIWTRHNRRYDLLTESRCQDLIDGFKSQGRQEFPAIVRKVDNDPDIDYEVICGARRHWTVTWLRAHNYPEFKYLIEVRDLTDEQAFRLSDIENRDNLDLSDYERATDYKNALESYYKNQKEMARRIEVSEAWLSRYLDLADLPAPVVKAFADITEIRTKYSRDLKPYLKDPRSRKKIIDCAKELIGIQNKRRKEKEALLTGVAVVKKLVGSTATRKKRTNKGVLTEYRIKNGQVMLSANRQGNSGLMLRVIPKSGATKKQLLKACEEALDAYL